MKLLFAALVFPVLVLAQANSFKIKKVYKSKNLVVSQIAANSYLHTSYKQTEDFGYVPCNGLIVQYEDEAIIFDSPTNDKSSEELILWVTNSLKSRIVAVIPTHFHDDCLGGLQAFHEKNINSYANSRTLQLAEKEELTKPKMGFDDSLRLTIGSEEVVIQFLGEGHTVDNVVGYFPKDQVIFGGCLIKAQSASRGYVGNANLIEWSNTVLRVKSEFPNAKIVVPGHGDVGDTMLLDYTIQLFSEYQTPK